MRQQGAISRFLIQDEYLHIQLPTHSWLRDQIYLYAVPRRHTDSKTKKITKEIIISSIYPNDWMYTWELKFNIKADRPGIVQKITKALTKLKLNICKQEGTIPSDEIEFSFWALVKIGDYVEYKNLDYSNLVIVKEILTNDIKEVLNNVFLNAHEDIVAEIYDIHIDKFLHENHYKNADGRNEIGIDELQSYFEVDNNIIQFELNNNIGYLPIKQIFSDLEIYSYRNEDIFFGTIISGLAQRNFYIIRFFEPGQPVIFIDINNKHATGTIERLANTIINASEGKANMIYNRAISKQDPPDNIENLESASHWYVLLDLSELTDLKLVNKILKGIKNSPNSFVNGVTVVDYTSPLNSVLEDEFKIKYHDILQRNIERKKKIRKRKKAFLYVLIILLIFNALGMVINWSSTLSAIKASPLIFAIYNFVTAIFALLTALIFAKEIGELFQGSSKIIKKINIE